MSKPLKQQSDKRLHAVKDTTTLCNSQKELIYVKIKKPTWRKCNRSL